MRRLLHLTCASMVLSGCFLDRSPFAVDGAPQPGMDAAPPVELDASTPEDGGPDDAAAPVDAQRPVDAFVPVDACIPAPDVCDGLDNDCDPTTPDGSAEPPGACDGDDDDQCADGTLVCMSGTLVCVEESPTRMETCNGEDDDCDGRIDEDAGCPCTHHIEGGHSYLFCREGKPEWEEAKAFCAARGYRLVIIGDEAEQRWLNARTQEIARDKAWWIGAQRTTEGDFVWLDGSRAEPPNFVNWQPREPNNSGGREHCAEMMGGAQGRGEVPGGWNDSPCDAERRFICEAAPAP